MNHTTRFWNDDDLVELGERDEAVERLAFIGEVKDQVTEIVGELAAVEVEIADLKKGRSCVVSLSDESLFKIRRGKRVTRADGDRHPGEIPVYSGSKDPLKPLTCVSRKWALAEGLIIESAPIVTVNANGYVGEVFVRAEECIIHDDVGVIEVLSLNIDLQYFAFALRAAISEGNYEYEAKLYSRVEQISVEIPSSGDELDVARQKQFSRAIMKFNTLKQRIAELGLWAGDARFKN